MKGIFLSLLLLVSFNLSYSQEIPPDSATPNKFFMNMGFSSNISGAEKTGIGLNLSLGYKLTDNLSIMFSSGYMTRYSDPMEYLQQRNYDYVTNSYYATKYYHGPGKFETIPIEISVRYHFDVLGVKPYIMYSVINEYVINDGDHDVKIETKNESTGQIINAMNGKASSLLDWDSKGFGEFHSMVSVGVLIPLTNKMNLDISYRFYGMEGLHSIRVGLNLDFE